MPGSNGRLAKLLQWTMDNAARHATTAEFFGAYNRFLVSEGFGIFRANFASRSLHPQFGALSLIWSTVDGVPLPPANASIQHMQKIAVEGGYVNLIRIKNADSNAQPFRDSPMAPVILRGETVRHKIEAGETTFRYAILKDMAALGGTDYLALPVNFRGKIEGFMSLACNKQGGFTAAEIEELGELNRLFTVALEARLKDELIGTLLRLYLGETTGPQVIAGRIKRGDMDTFESVIWFSDIRGFSAMSSIMQPEEIIEMLNSYYETIIPVVRRYGGEVLKFLGDGLLVIFNARSGKERQAKYQSLLAANGAGKALKKLNTKRVSEGKIPLDHGIGLHFGLIQYGNIGSDDRLDFTAIGSAVNIASRVAALCAELGKTILISGQLAGFLRIRLEKHGSRDLKGIPQPVEIFSLPPRQTVLP